MLNEVQTIRLIIGLLGIALIIISPSILVFFWKRQHDPFKGVFMSVALIVFGIGFFLSFLVWGY